MIHTEVNETLADLLEVYRVKVTNLEDGREMANRELESARYEVKRLNEKCDRILEDANRNQKLIRERAEKNVELTEKVKKLEGVIESLHIELQTEREAHQATKENQA